MRRIQLHLDEDLDDALAGQAREQGVPKAALIRQYLRRHVTPRRPGNDPSVRLTGIYEGGEDDSTSINDVLYGR